MNKIVTPFLFFLFLFLMDRFFFLPGRMNGSWEYENGSNAGDIITFQDIDILNNCEIKVRINKNSTSFYLVGCYFGTLYLLNEDTLEYTRYTVLEGIDE